MYHGSNNLRIEFAWTPTLNVQHNNIHKSWDYSKIQPAPSYYDAGFPQVPSQFACDSNYQNHGMAPQPDNYGRFNAMTQPTQSRMVACSMFPQYQPNVIIVSGLSYDTANTDRVFNLLSLYGNVSKVQFLPDQQGTAVVQMFDQASAENCVKYLDKVPFGGHGQLEVYWFSQAIQLNSNDTFLMSDGTLNFKDFVGNRNQRFMQPRPSYWIQAPSKFVRFYNAPFFITRNNLLDIFALKNVPAKDCTIFPANVDGSRTSRGQLEFPSVGQAVLAVMKCNNKEMKSLGTSYLKLCFSYPSSSFDANK